MYLAEKWKVQPCTEGLDIHCYSWFKRSENSLIDYCKNAAEKQLVSVKCTGFQEWVLGLIPNLLFAVSGHRKNQRKYKFWRGSFCSRVTWSIFCRHVQSWYRMCLQFIFFFPLGRPSAFPSFICLQNQAPACAEPGRGPWASLQLGVAALQLAWHLVKQPAEIGNTLVIHTSSSNSSQKRPSRSRGGFLSVCVCVCLGWKGPLKVVRFCVDYGNLFKWPPE